MSTAPVSVPPAVLMPWVSQVLQQCGVRPDDAQVTAHALIRTSLRGIDTHGIARLPAYVERLAKGDFNAQAQPTIATQYGLLRCHGDDGLGQVVVDRALQACLQQAQHSAVVACHIEACGHLGALGVLLLPAVEAGCVAFLCQQTPPIMALPGASAAAIGNNPLAFAIPVNDKPPVLFDTALSAVARGHILTAAREGGTPIPAHWALDVHGHVTRDPRAALEGALQPMGGYKGLGLAMLVECLAGALRSEQPRSDIDDLKESGGSAGHLSAFLLLINPRFASNRDMFSTHTHAWLHTLTSSSPDARYPGERQHRCEEQRRFDGIPLPEEILHQLHMLAVATGVKLPL